MSRDIQLTRTRVVTRIAPIFWIGFLAISILWSTSVSVSLHSVRVSGGATQFAPICTSEGLRWLDTSTGDLTSTMDTDESTRSSDGFCASCFGKAFALHCGTLISSFSMVPFLYWRFEKVNGFSFRLGWRTGYPRAPPEYLIS